MKGSKKTEGLRPPGSGDLATSPRVQARYRAVRQAILAILPTEPPGLTEEELGAAIGPHLPRGLFPNGPGFYPLAVQAHLQSIGLIRWVEGSRPPRIVRSVDIDFA
jgi:hypothetical protein